MVTDQSTNVACSSFPDESYTTDSTLFETSCDEYIPNDGSLSMSTPQPSTNCSSPSPTPPEMSSVSISTIDSPAADIAPLVATNPNTIAPVTTPITSPTAIFGFKIVGDNVDKNVKPRYMRSDNRLQSLHYFHSFAIKSRIDIAGLSDIPPDPLDTVDISKLLPNDDDDKQLHNNFRVHIERMLVRNIQFLKFACDDLITLHIKHKYYSEMSGPSEIVSY